MYEMKWIELTGLANAAYQREVVLPACERRAAQGQVLDGVPGTRTSLLARLRVRLSRGQRETPAEVFGRPPNVILPEA